MSIPRFKTNTKTKHPKLENKIETQQLIEQIKIREILKR
jgi:hypothetical protein